MRDADWDREMDRRDASRDEPEPETVRVCGCCAEALDGRHEIDHSGDAVCEPCGWDDSTAMLGTVLTYAPCKASTEDLQAAWDTAFELLQRIKVTLDARQRGEWRAAARQADAAALMRIVRPL